MNWRRRRRRVHFAQPPEEKEEEELRGREGGPNLSREKKRSREGRGISYLGLDRGSYLYTHVCLCCAGEKGRCSPTEQNRRSNIGIPSPEPRYCTPPIDVSVTAKNLHLLCVYDLRLLSCKQVFGDRFPIRPGVTYVERVSLTVAIEVGVRSNNVTLAAKFACKLSLWI